MTTWILSRTITNTFHKSLNLSHYLGKFQANIEVTDQTSCGIWIDTTAVGEDIKEVAISKAMSEMATDIQKKTSESRAKEKNMGIATHGRE